MGNDQSHIKNLNFSEEERKPAEKINGCFLFDGVYENTKITVIEEMEHNNVGNKYFNGTALERSIKVC